MVRSLIVSVASVSLILENTSFAWPGSGMTFALVATDAFFCTRLTEVLASLRSSASMRRPERGGEGELDVIGGDHRAIVLLLPAELAELGAVEGEDVAELGGHGGLQPGAERRFNALARRWCGFLW